MSNKMKMRHNLTVTIITALIAFSSCQRNNFKEYVGPALCPSNSFAFVAPFTVESSGSANNTVDFASSGAVKISAEMNEAVKWEIVVKGNTTGAVKRYQGNSKSIQIKWYGEPDSATFFGVEKVTVSLKLPCKDAIVSSITVASKPTFVVPRKFLMFTDFDGNGAAPSSFSGAYGNLGTVNPSFVPSTPSPQGGACYQMVCAASVPVWYFSGFASLDTKISDAYPYDPPVSVDSVYFNCFLNSNGKTNTNVTFTINGANKNVLINWKGWKYVSFSLGSIGVAKNALPSGVSYSIGSAPTQGTSAEIWIDMPMFSFGAPLLVE